MLAVALALAASAIWGVSDFVAGLLARRYGALVIAVLGQIVGLAAVGAVAAMLNLTAHLTGILLAMGGGACTVVTSTCFYAAMRRGLISIASPLLASGSVLSFTLAVASGERPGKVAIVGAAVTLAGMALSSLEGGLREFGERGAGAIPFALVAAAASGTNAFLVGRASKETGSILAVLSQRSTSSVLLLVIAAGSSVTLPREWRAIPGLLFLGVGSASALMLYAAASSRGLISIAVVLVSLYPVYTVLLSHILLRERLRGHQLVGVPLILSGISLVALGR